VSLACGSFNLCSDMIYFLFVFRMFVGKLQPPVIPFMPLLLKDMTFAHEGNKTSLDGLVNFEKMHMMAQTMRTVRYCRSRHLGNWICLCNYYIPPTHELNVFEFKQKFSTTLSKQHNIFFLSTKIKHIM
jgi:hypothetical protein